MNLIERAKNIIAKPKLEWNIIATEDTPIKNSIISYAIPLVLIGAIATFIGVGLIGTQTILSGRVADVNMGIVNAIIYFLVGILSVTISAYVIDFLAPNFSSEKNIDKSAQLAIYSNTPLWIASILHFFPSVLTSLVSLAALIYGIYLWYLGLGPLKKTPEDKKATYIFVSILIMIVAYFLISFIIGMILFSVFGFGNNYKIV